MDVVSVTKYAKISPTKVRDLARKITGMPVSEALQVTDFSERKGAFLLSKTLKSAVANAENNAKLAVDELRVKEAIIDEGPSLRRYWPRARGMVSPIKRRTSHIRVVVTDGKDEEGV